MKNLTKDLIKEIIEINADRCQRYKRDILIMIPPGDLFKSFENEYISKFGSLGLYHHYKCFNNGDYLALIEGKISGQLVPHFDTLVIVNSKDIDPKVIDESMAIPMNVSGKIPTLENITILPN